MVTRGQDNGERRQGLVLPHKPTSTDEDSLRIWVVKHCRVNQELMVDRLIELCALGFTVQDENLAEMEGMSSTARREARS